MLILHQIRIISKLLFSGKMIDFVKVQIINTTDIWIQNLERNSLLEFKTVVSTRSGELSDKKEAEYKGMKFITKVVLFYSKVVYISTGMSESIIIIHLHIMI